MKPLHAQVSDYVLEKIQSNEWQVGYMLPTEMELCRQFGVSRPSVRSALLPLVNEGYLKRVKGKGTFVTKPPKIEDTTLFFESLAEEMRVRGKDIVSEVLEFLVWKADERICGKLQLPEGSSVIKLTRLRYCKDTMDSGPIVLTTSYLTMKAAFLQDYDMSKTALHDALAEHGIARTHIEKHIKAAILDHRSCRLLGIAPDSLAILLHTYSRDNDNELIEYAESYYPADRNEFVIKVRV